jgi:hypothetical protein
LLGHDTSGLLKNTPLEPFDNLSKTSFSTTCWTSAAASYYAFFRDCPLTIVPARDRAWCRAASCP